MLTAYEVAILGAIMSVPEEHPCLGLSAFCVIGDVTLVH